VTTSVREPEATNTMPHSSRQPDAASREPISLRVLPTMNEDGSRRWLRPRLSKGRYLVRRRLVAYFLIVLFTLIPYLRINGKPLILLDLATRHFTLFGRTFLPTDTFLLALLLVGVFVAIFLLTALFGRVWCGWACPQTVYMEFVFRPIERLFEGQPGRAKKGWLAGKPFSKPLKMVVYVIISMYLAHTFLSYFVGVENLRHWVTRSPLEHPAPFLVMLAVTSLMLFDFGFFREQTCLLACPYGRLQSVLLDRNSLIVRYNSKRGEPRGKAKRSSAASNSSAIAPGPVESPIVTRSVGDCVDCGLCVVTCPTGIDIREGLQMECINCTQCIDACDSVMDKLGRDRGLIGYGSQAELAGERKRLLRPRVVLYPLILVLIVSTFLFVLINRAPADIMVMRATGRPYVELADGHIGNPVRIKISNRSEQTCSFQVAVSGVQGSGLMLDENPVVVAPGQVRTLSAMIAVPYAAFADHEHEAIVDLLFTDTSAPATPNEAKSPYRKHASFRLIGPGRRDMESREKRQTHDESEEPKP